MDEKQQNIFKQGFAQAKNYIGEFLTGVIALALVVYSFVSLGFRNQIDEFFITTFIIGFILMVVITSVWYPNAKQKAQYTDSGYIKQRSGYGGLVDKVTVENKQKNLTQFCEWATEENKVYIIKQKLLKHGIDYDTYTKYEKQPSKIYDTINGEDEEELTEKQKKFLKKLIENGVNVKLIISTNILTGIKNGKLKYDVSSFETKYDTISIGSKVLTSVASAIVMAFLVFSVGGFSWASIGNLLLWYILMAWNMFTSYQTGYKSISIHRTNYYKKLRTFLEEFVSSEYFEGKQKIEDIIPSMVEQIPNIAEEEKAV